MKSWIPPLAVLCLICCVGCPKGDKPGDEKDPVENLKQNEKALVEFIRENPGFMSAVAWIDEIGGKIEFDAFLDDVGGQQHDEIVLPSRVAFRAERPADERNVTQEGRLPAGMVGGFADEAADDGRRTVFHDDVVRDLGFLERRAQFVGGNPHIAHNGLRDFDLDLRGNVIALVDVGFDGHLHADVLA